MFDPPWIKFQFRNRNRQDGSKPVAARQILFSEMEVLPGDGSAGRWTTNGVNSTPADYGAKLSNGLYYALQKTEDGLVGRPMAVDLNDIAALPQDHSVPPFDQAARADIVPGARWIEALVIR